MTTSSSMIRTQRIVIAGVKFVVGGVECLTGVVLLLISGARIDRIFAVLAAIEMQEDPRDFLVRFLDHIVPLLLREKLFIALTLLIIGVAKIVAAIGFVRRRAWGYQLLVGLLILLIPFDVFHLVTHLSVSAGVVTGINVLMFATLIVLRKQFLHEAQKD